jgi:transposase
MLTAFLLPLNSGLVVDGATVTATEFTLQVTTAAPTAYCPLCHHASSQVHSRYSRTLHDLAIAGHQVRLQLTTRRFFCRVPTSPRRIFTERLPLLTRPYAHRTLRQRDTLHRVALTAGGESGARLAAVLARPASPATLLRLIRQLPPPPAPTPRVLGVDDWAKRKGYTYGTILCDLETGRVVDLLADREAATFAAWLHAHPGIEIISRDRAEAYAEGARRGAPTARQVADRFHVLVNLGRALEDLLRRLYPQLQAAFAAADSNNPPTQEPIQPSGEPDSPPAPPQGAVRP